MVQVVAVDTVDRANDGGVLVDVIDGLTIKRRSTQPVFARNPVGPGTHVVGGDVETA